MKHPIPFILLAALLLSVSCTETIEKSDIHVTSISLSRNIIELVEGESISLTATISPSDATDTNVSWSSSKSSVASVDQKGTVSALSVGTTTIMASAGGKSSSCTVTVVSKTIAVSSITLDKTELSLNVGEEYHLKATIEPSNASEKNLSWSSLSSSIATVKDGLVKGVSAGETEITASCGGHKAVCKVKVTPIEVESITLSKTELDLFVGDSETITVTIKPDNATNQQIMWSTSNDQIATVNNGTITGIKEGSATISASNGNIKATCSVTVSSGVLSIHNSKKGGLQEELSKYDFSRVQGLKISGVLNDIDFLYIKDNTSHLNKLDLSEVEIEEIPILFGGYHGDKPIDIVFPNTLTIIKERQFCYSGLRFISFGKNLEIICDAAFGYCSLLESIVFASNSRLREIKGPEIPESHDSSYLGDMLYSLHGAFSNCDKLESISFPSSLEIIGISAFQHCSSLKKVSFEDNSQLKKIDGRAAFSVGAKLGELYASDFNGYSRGAFKGCSSLNEITLPNSIEEIGGSAFQSTAISELNWQDLTHLTTIGELAFAYSKITSVFIPSNLESLGEGAFLNCTQLSSLSFNKGSKITKLGRFCFGTNNTCSSLEQAILPASITSLGCTFSHRIMTSISFEQNSQLESIESLFNYGKIETLDASNCEKVTYVGKDAWNYGTKVIKLGTTTPPSLYSSAEHVPILKVPSSAVNAYRNNQRWANTFDSISALDD